MKQKNFGRLLLLIFIVSVLTVLCACNDEIRDIPDDYPNLENVETMTVNLYLPVEEGTTEKAMNSVKTALNLRMLDLDKSVDLRVHYILCTGLDAQKTYNDNILAVAEGRVAPNEVAKDAATMQQERLEASSGEAVRKSSVNVILVNNYDLMMELYASVKSDDVNVTKKIEDLSSLMTKNPYVTLKASINGDLLAASKINDTHYCIPNNRDFGHYEYIVIDKAVVRDELKFIPYSVGTDTVALEDVDTYAEYAALLSAVEEKIALSENTERNASDYVKYLTGSYGDRFSLTKGDTQIVNIAASPVVTAEDAFTSCYCISKKAYADDPLPSDYLTRAMQVIYYLNADKGPNGQNPTESLPNLLRYGVAGTHYIYEPGEKISVQPIDSADADAVRYSVDRIYCGNNFLLLDDEKWDKATQEYAYNQSKDTKANFITLALPEELYLKKSQTEISDFIIRIRNKLGYSTLNYNVVPFKTDAFGKILPESIESFKDSSSITLLLYTDKLSITNNGAYAKVGNGASSYSAETVGSVDSDKIRLSVLSVSNIDLFAKSIIEILQYADVTDNSVETALRTLFTTGE